MNKVAAVTGSRRGIGLGILQALARQGYQTVMSGTASLADTLPILEPLRRQGLAVDYVPCDISKQEDRSRFFSWIDRRYGRLDVHVNNAGVAPLQRNDVLEMTQESFERVVGTNLRGTFFMCQLAANLMLDMKQRGLEDYTPRLINISSISSYTSSVNRGEYCISKAGVSMVTRLFADRLAQEEIPVFEVSPGIILTDMTAGVKEKYEQMIAQGVTPIRRFGQPKDVADCVLAACSGLLDFATGQVIHADGGFHLRRL
ncbi:MAG TPA: 3-ketoacyl-ACP reductase [Candidatus Gallacutalibacter stercoravium]|nr:3-ketoacyl-ACP reductase [Candidatus Gallacutalibacter stercoravium]